jgi:hypothetical protein
MPNDTMQDPQLTAPHEIHQMFLQVDAALHRLLQHTERPDFDADTAIQLWDEVGHLQEKLRLPLVSRFVTILPDTPAGPEDPAAA